MPEESRYLRGMVSWLGFKQCGITYVRDARYAGKTKYTFRKMIRFAFNGIASFSEKPLVLAGWLGLLVTAGGFAFLLYIIIGKLLHPDAIVTGWASLMGIVIFFGGIQLLSLGILGQYIGRIYREVKRRPLYILEAAWGWDSSIHNS
jgi:dolichol-phosphate mannosyltransferase